MAASYTRQAQRMLTLAYLGRVKFALNVFSVGFGNHQPIVLLRDHFAIPLDKLFSTQGLFKLFVLCFSVF